MIIQIAFFRKILFTISDARVAAPNPLSILTIAKPGEQDCNIVVNAP